MQIAREKKFFHWVENIIKQLIRQLCVHRDMKPLVSLKSTQEARVALGYASSNSYASFVLSKLPASSYLDERTLTYEPIVN